jgi:hypothetical protein
MFHLPPSSKVATACAVVALLLGVGLSPANAAVGASTAPVLQSVGAGTWSAVATTAGAAPYGNGPLALNFARSSLIKFAFFNLANTGTLPLLSASLAVTVIPATATVVIESCSVAWSENLNLCFGGTIRTVVSSATPSTTTMAFPSASLSSVRLRATLTILSAVDVSATINVSVPRSGARSATVSSS